MVLPKGIGGAGFGGVGVNCKSSNAVAEGRDGRSWVSEIVVKGMGVIESESKNPWAVVVVVATTVVATNACDGRRTAGASPIDRVRISDGA